MDSISTAIMAAIATGVLNSKSPEQVSDTPTAQAYQALKAALHQKYGTNSDLAQAVKKLEEKPTSAGRKQVLKEEVAAVQANQERELIGLVRHLLDQISAKLDSQSHYAPADAPIHLQRPLPTAHFIGRKMELAQLLAGLQPGHVVALCGPAGVGKSTLVAEAVWKLAPADLPPSTFPDGIIYHNFYNQPRVDVALERIARTFNENPTPTPYDAAQRALVERRALLVLDGADRADDLSGILDVRGGCGIVMTCQEPPPGNTELQLIDPLRPDEARQLLRAWGGPYIKNQPVAGQICELVGGLPLAIRLVGHYLTAKKQNAADYLDWLKTTPLSEMTPQKRRQESLPFILEHTAAGLTEPAQQLLAVAGLLALDPFSQEPVIEALTPESHYGVVSAIRRIFKQKPQNGSPDIDQSLIELENYGLLQPVDANYQLTHPLVHHYAEQRLTAPPKALRRLATYYIGFAWEQSGLGAQGQTVLDANRPHIMRILTKCLQWQDWEAAHGLAVAVEDYLDFRGYIAERIIANEVGLVAAWQLGRTNEAAWMGNLGDTYRAMGQARWAIEHFEKALAAARRQGDWESEGNWLGNLGLAYRDLGQIEQARQYLKESQAIFEEIQSSKAALVRDWLAELDELAGD